METRGWARWARWAHIERFAAKRGVIEDAPAAQRGIEEVNRTLLDGQTSDRRSTYETKEGQRCGEHHLHAFVVRNGSEWGRFR